MLSSLKIDIGAILKTLATIFGLGFIYKKGKDAQSIKAKEIALEKLKEDEKIGKDNIRKSNIAILDELRNEYSRNK